MPFLTVKPTNPEPMLLSAVGPPSRPIQEISYEAFRNTYQRGDVVLDADRAFVLSLSSWLLA
jgi:hypothetical protein